MIHNIDENLGRLLARLEESGIAKNTLVVVMNDNGGTAGTKVFNAGMRGRKVTAWLGGTRAFSFWRWPGKFAPADCGALTAHIDVFRTIVTLAGAKLPPEAETQIEGRDLTPLLQEPAAFWPERTLFTHAGRWPKSAAPETAKYRQCAVRDARYTLVSEKGAAKPVWELYDVLADPAQARNIAAEYPAEVERLAAAYQIWWTSVQPQLVNETTTGLGR
jgi:arylsulfatase